MDNKRRTLTPMELRCPHCGKKQTLTVAKLTASGGVVICPQCVSEFTVDVSKLPKESPAVAEPAHEAAAAPHPHSEAAFCSTCGKGLPARGLNFCPFCGAPLPFAEVSATASTASSAAPQRATMATTQKAPEQSKQASAEENTLIALPFVKVPHFIPHKHEPASLRFKLMAWVVIARPVAICVGRVGHGKGEKPPPPTKKTHGRDAIIRVRIKWLIFNVL